MGIQLAFPLAHLPLLAIISVLTAVAIPSWRAPPRKGFAGHVLRAGAACRSALGRTVLGIVAAIGLYVIAMVAGTLLVTAMTPRSASVERSA